MSIFTAPQQVPALIRPVVTIGSFDGVHIGHQSILKQVCDKAAAIDGESILLTFEPHPRKFLHPAKPLQLLTPLQEKLPLLQKNGIEHVLVVHFDERIANLSAEAYIDELLVKHLKPKAIVVGYDHRYGKNREGGLPLLQQKSEQHGYEVEELSATLIDEAAISSTKIREALLAGNLNTVHKMLGRHYAFKGRVVHGQKLGRQLGYPTANLRLSNYDQLLPAHGVYAVAVLINGAHHAGMMNIGYRPTVGGDKALHIEVHLFDFDSDIYGALPEVQLLHFLRPEQKFESLEALRGQLQEDEKSAKAFLQSSI